jgi:hypothetical protein
MFVQNQLHSLVPRRTSQCVCGKKPFQSGDRYVSFLKMTEKGWVRKDYCEMCWKNSQGTDPEGLIWKGKIPLKRQKIMTADEKANHLFRTLVNEKSEDLENQKLTFVLALYLERKKELVARGVLKNKSCFEHVESGEVFALDRVQLSQEEFDKTVSSLLEKL